MNASTLVGIGLIGAGRIGQLHAENLAFRVPGAKLLAVTDVQAEAAKRCAAKLQIPSVHENSDAVFRDPKIDAVVICSSTDTHSRLIEQAATAGKHVFCEKPIDFDLKRIDRALDAVKRAGVKLQIGFNRRFDPNFRHVQQAVASGQVGKPHLLRITSRDPAPPPLEYVKVSGGLFLDMTIHDFDMARYLVGSEVTEVYAAGNVLIDPAIGQAGDIDTAVITLRFENGALGVIDNSRQAVYGYDQRVEVLGAKGMIAAENPLPHYARTAGKEGFHSAPLLHFFLERYSESYVAEMRAFIECIQNDAAPPVTGEDGRMPVVIGLAAKRSLTEGRPVKLSEIKP